jgi:8-oxo-dGTP diphosphatase
MTSKGRIMAYYIEEDGRLFLVERDGVLDLPEAGEVPFEIDCRSALGEAGGLRYCTAHLRTHPWHWTSKDEVPTMPNVSPRVRAAVHASMPRVVVEAICRKQDEVLLVKGCRGLTKGRWTLPGGFLQFGETPEDGLLREVREEIGARAAIQAFRAVRAKVGKHTCLHWIMLFYDVALEDAPVPNPDEIAEVLYVPVSEAPKLLGDPTMAQVMKGLLPPF